MQQLSLKLQVWYDPSTYCAWGLTVFVSKANVTKGLTRPMQQLSLRLQVWYDPSTYCAWGLTAFVSKVNIRRIDDTNAVAFKTIDTAFENFRAAVSVYEHNIILCNIANEELGTCMLSYLDLT